jgi:hypothetical protein
MSDRYGIYAEVSMTQLFIDPTKITVFCDESSDRMLFRRLQDNSELLGQIPKENIDILPSGRNLFSLDEVVSELAGHDRPDYIVLYDKVPVVVIELTEHGYTGDNPLQRFTRFATSAEHKIPFVYFTPFSRVRDDELDIEGSIASKRSVNTNVWAGMIKLAEIYSVPQIAINWPLAPNGKPQKLSQQADSSEVMTVFGELISTLEYLLPHAEAIASKQSIMEDQFIVSTSNKVRKLAETPNIRPSVVRSEWTRSRFLSFLGRPTSILEYITTEKYFYKDKPERLLALACIKNAKFEKLNDDEISDKGIVQDLASVLARDNFENPFIYYSGYKWRSDPHCGVLVNLDYVYCRTLEQSEVNNRKSALILFWPRIFRSRDSEAYKKTAQELKDLVDHKGAMYDDFIKRYGSEEEAHAKIRQLCFSRDGRQFATSELIGVWSNGTKQSRIFRQYCDLIVLSDGIITGNHLN